jgi:hypothetical protein
MYQHLDDLILPGFIDYAEHISQMMDVGGVLPNYPLVDQLHEPTSDHLLDENARMNCVPASNAGIVKFKCFPNHQDVNGDFLKDHVYGQGHTGGGSQEAYAPFLKSEYGIETTIQRSADRMQLVQWAINNISIGDPSMITMPSAWNSQITQPNYNPNAPDWPTHAGVVFGFNPTTHELLIANPWGGFIHRGTYQYWADRFCFEKVYHESLAGVAHMPLPTGWKDVNSQLTQDQTPYVVEKGMRQKILDAPYWNPANVPIGNEKKLAAGEVLELSNPAYGAGDQVDVQQRFRMSWLAARQDKNGVWSVTEEWVGVEADWLRHEVDRLNAEVATLKAAPAMTPASALALIAAALKDAGKL